MSKKIGVGVIANDGIVKEVWAGKWNANALATANTVLWINAADKGYTIKRNAQVVILANRNENVGAAACPCPMRQLESRI